MLVQAGFDKSRIQRRPSATVRAMGVILPPPLSPPAITSRAADRAAALSRNGIIGIRHPGCPTCRHDDGQRLRGPSSRRRRRGFRTRSIRPRDRCSARRRLGFDGARSGSSSSEQRYDFASGELSTSLGFRVGGTTATSRSLAFCSAIGPGPRGVELTVRVDGPPTSRSPRASTRPMCLVAATPRPAAGPGPERGGRRAPRWHPPGDIACRAGLRDDVPGRCRRGASTATRTNAAGSRPHTELRARADRAYR